MIQTYHNTLLTKADYSITRAWSFGRIHFSLPGAGNGMARLLNSLATARQLIPSPLMRRASARQASL